MSATPRLLGGRYEVGELIGRGGMAEVHEGFDNRLGRQVAIKMLRSDLARDQTFIGRFRREAQSAAGLNHASIVAVYDSGEDHVTQAGGAVLDVPYIVMEYVGGETLRDYLTERTVLDPAEAARVTEGILDALAYSHRAGIVHRDIKPSNVMVGPDDEVKVMDFGIARAIADSNATMTQTQAVIGTAQYLSPEQAQGQQVDARSDLYSTGCLLFELLTGRAPFIGDTPVAIAYQHVGEAPPRPSALNPDVPEAMDAVVAHALVKDRDARYQSAEEFRTDLLRARLDRPISAAALGSAAALAGGSPAHTVTRTPPAGAVGGAMPTEVYAAQTSPPTDQFGNTASLPAVGHDPVDNPDKRRVGAYVLLTVAVLVVAALLGWGAKTLLAGDAPAPPQQVTVPQLKGLTQAQADQKLRAEGLQGQPNEIPSNITKGLVVDQTQAAGSKVDKDTKINYDVSLGPSTVTVPDVTDMSVADATKELTGVGLVVSPTQKPVNDSSYDKGQVDSTTPAANDTASTGSTVVLNVSTGNVTVPNILGKSLSDAATALATAHLNPNFVYVASDKTRNTVIAQSPSGGVLLARDKTVTVQVAIPKEPTTTTTTPATTTTTTSQPTTPATTTTTTGTSP